MCPSQPFGEASNALAVVELPTDAEKPTHTRPSGIRSSKPLVPPVELLLPPTVPTGLSFFLLLFSFFVPIASFPQRNFAPGSPRNDDRQLGRPTTSPVLSLLMCISLSQSRSLPTSECFQGNLALL